MPAGSSSAREVTALAGQVSGRHAVQAGPLTAALHWNFSAPSLLVALADRLLRGGQLLQVERLGARVLRIGQELPLASSLSAVGKDGTQKRRYPTWRWLSSRKHEVEHLLAVARDSAPLTSPIT